MRCRNDDSRYGAVAVLLHWSVALTVVGLFVLGVWMRTLSYYDTWYHRGPWLHKGVGVVLFALLLLRLLWRWLNPRPAPLAGHAPWERRAAGLTHGLLYLLLFAVMLTGYLMDTAEGHPLDVFGWFSIPAAVSLPHQADVAGYAHRLLAWLLIALAAGHAGAALKHHFIDKDRTLLRMLGR